MAERAGGGDPAGAGRPDGAELLDLMTRVVHSRMVGVPRGVDRADVIQDACEAVLRARAADPALWPIVGWRGALDAHRRLAHTRRRGGAVQVPLDDSAAVAAPEPDVPLRVDLARFLAELPPRTRLICELRAGGFTGRQVAELLGVTDGAISHQLARAANSRGARRWVGRPPRRSAA